MQWRNVNSCNTNPKGILNWFAIHFSETLRRGVSISHHPSHLTETGQPAAWCVVGAFCAISSSHHFPSTMSLRIHQAGFHQHQFVTLKHKLISMKYKV